MPSDSHVTLPKPEGPINLLTVEELINHGPKLTFEEERLGSTLTELQILVLKQHIAQTANEAHKLLFSKIHDPDLENRRAWIRGQLEAFIGIYNSHLNATKDA